MDSLYKPSRRHVCERQWDSDAQQDEVFSELVRPLLAMVPLGYSVSLMLWEAHHAGIKPQPQGTGQHHSIIQQVIETFFQEPKPPGDGREHLQTVSFVQLCADGNARDLLSPRNQALHVLDVPPLGLMVDEASEIVVSNSTAAYSVYVRGLEDSPALSQGCSQQSQVERHAATCASLFTLTVEQELEGCRRQRSAVRILDLSPLLQALAPGELPDDAGFLPWILKRTLEGNNLTFLLLCLTLPEGVSQRLGRVCHLEGIRISNAPGLCSQQMPEALWMVALPRTWLAAPHGQQVPVVVKHSTMRSPGPVFQVLKNQSWEKKKEMSEAFEGSGSCHPEAKVNPGFQLLVTALQVGSWASQQHPALELQFAVAKARRQRLREQHQRLIQQELLKLEEELAENQERDAWCWPKEKAVLALQLEALRREWAEAEKDLEALYQQHRLEAEAQKQHVLQVFRAYRGLSEEQTDALDRRYRKLLQEALQDAISLSAQNQQLRAHSQMGCTDHATQTDPHS
ncbi:PTB domain-containing engulfment adapter protein 1 [Platysternon megacephalum]|uniref:PTB domain-containing engulfment adapter protein 1 n=1 Tax=Platysternon megacephalum TaxID=55544 RepID=A0A4D9EVD2_9SAUR|nr:PTB domain-containing engulfment adapter protein 1 [Platysternon megacephalum]